MRRLIVGLCMLMAGWAVWAAPAPAAAADLPPLPQMLADRVMGQADAPITILDYSSFTCPHCAEFTNDTLPKIEKDWVKTGKAKIIFRDFPLDRGALMASMVARCAGPSQFWGYVDVLFRSQATWANEKINDELAKIARMGGMDQATFDACLADKPLEDGILAIRMKGEKEFGIDSTPTFIINGKKIVGALPYEDFKKALEAAVSK